MNKEIIKLDNISAILDMTKAEAENFQAELKSLIINENKKITFQNFSAIKKLYGILDKILKDESLKEEAKNGFIEQFGGSKTELIYGFKTTLASYGEYTYSEELQNEINEYEELGKIIDAKKEYERKIGIAEKTITKDSLKFELK